MFQGVAEAELEKDLERTFKIFFSSSSEAVRGSNVHTHPALQCAVSELNRWKNHPHVMNVFLCTTEGSSPSQHRRSVRLRWRFLLVISVCCECWRFLNLHSQISCCVCALYHRWPVCGSAGADSQELHADRSRPAVLRQPVQRKRLQVADFPASCRLCFCVLSQQMIFMFITWKHPLWWVILTQLFVKISILITSCSSCFYVCGTKMSILQIVDCWRGEEIWCHKQIFLNSQLNYPVLWRITE